MTTHIRVPLSKFKREIRKWLKVSQDIDIIITKRGVDCFVVVGYERMEIMRSITNGNINE